ncbi:uncharacterized protein LOC109498652 [Felis catus]|uniref:uncharacterized protein LOC109498652 n=1 Tax=Felis catus TaxID=9685 RepID=UPI001D1A1EEB|nr:uncharacterized protein LOC109498652 [Felis catus]
MAGLLGGLATPCTGRGDMDLLTRWPHRRPPEAHQCPFLPLPTKGNLVCSCLRQTPSAQLRHPAHPGVMRHHVPPGQRPGMRPPARRPLTPKASFCPLAGRGRAGWFLEIKPHACPNGMPHPGVFIRDETYVSECSLPFRTRGEHSLDGHRGLWLSSSASVRVGPGPAHLPVTLGTWLPAPSLQHQADVKFMSTKMMMFLRFK